MSSLQVSGFGGLGHWGGGWEAGGMVEEGMWLALLLCHDLVPFLVKKKKETTVTHTCNQHWWSIAVIDASGLCLC